MPAQAAQPVPLDLQAYVDLGRLGGVALAPGGAWVAAAIARPDSHRGRYRSALWRLPLDGGQPTCLVSADAHARSPAFDAAGALLFLGEQRLEQEGEPTLDQVMRLDPGGPVALTDAPRGVEAFQVAASGDRLAWLQPHRPDLPDDQQRSGWLREQRHGPGARWFRRQPTRYWKQWLGREGLRLWTALADGSQPAPVGGTRPRTLFEASWRLSPDGRWLVRAVNRQGPDRLDDSELWLLDLDEGQDRLLAHSPGVRWSRLRFDAAGQRLAAVRHQRLPGRRGPEELWVLDLAEQVPPRHLAHDWDRWPEPIGWLGDEVICTARDRAAQPLVAIHSHSGRVRPLLRQGIIEGLAVLGSHLVGVQHDLLHAPVPAIVDLARPRLQRLALPAPAPPELSARVEHRNTALPSGEAVPWLWLRPAGLPPDQPLPTLLWVHGGPVSHWADWWHWRWNPALFASYGYAIALPNPRGSTGYGQAWIEGIWNNRWGEQCVDDLRAVLDELVALPGVDPGRVAAMGASFGGWMVNRLGGLESRFACIVSHAGIFDDRAFAGSTDQPPYWHWEHGGTPWDDPQHDRWSPHRVVEGWRAPTLVSHGERDYRVPLTQGLALFEALLHHGVEAELLAFPDEGHWIERPPNILAWHQHVLAFLSRHLGGPAPRPAAVLPPASSQDW